MANTVIVIGSGVGVNAAVKRNTKKTANLHGFKIDLPETNPSKFSSNKNKGRTKAIPNKRINRITKSRYSSNLTRLPKSFGVKPSKTSTACGRSRYAQRLPTIKSGVAQITKKIAIRFSRL